MKNKSNQKKIYISIIIILSIISVVSIVYNFLGGFYHSRISEYYTVLGEEKTIEIDNIGSFSQAFNFSGTTLTGDNITQKVMIQTKNLAKPLKLRAKGFINGFTDDNTKLLGFTNWEYRANDEYIYFNQEISSNEKIGLCKYININKKLRLEHNLNYVLIITVESYD